MNLFDPVVFRNGVRARNRLALAPLTNLQSHPDGTLSEAEQRWLVRRARGGFGVVCTCASHVALDGQGWVGQMGIFDDRLVPQLSGLAAQLREHGAVGLVQLFHGGVRAPSKITGQQPWSASAFHEESPGFEAPREGSEDDIQRVIVQFRQGAERALRAGFGGVEVHGAHGYLLSQFLSATMNRRSDRWGGSIEHRARLTREIVRAIRAAVPASFVVGVRLSPEDFGYARGIDLDETLQVARWLCDDGVDFLHLSLWQALQNTKKQPERHPMALFREACPADVPLLAAGSIWSRAEAEALLAHGADVVALGRAAIVNPEWPSLAVDPTWEPRRPPVSIEELVARDVSPTFAEYLRRWKGFVA